MINTGNLRLDDLHINGLKIFQDPNGFCFGTDAVLLAWFCRRKKFENAVDLCSGNGIIPLLLSLNPFKSIIGVELLKNQVEIALKSIEYNNLHENIKMVNENIKNITSKNLKDSPILKINAFDLVSANPPYFADGSGFAAEGQKGLARTEKECELRDVISAAELLLKNGGRFCMVYKPERLAQVICMMREYKIEPKSLLIVSPKKSKKPAVFLIEGKKGANADMIIEKPLFIYDENGKYTDEMNAVYSKENVKNEK